MIAGRSAREPDGRAVPYARPMSTTPPTESPQRRLLIMAAPSPGKLPKDMSDDDRRAWARSIVEQMAVAYREGAGAASGRSEG